MNPFEMLMLAADMTAELIGGYALLVVPSGDIRLIHVPTETVVAEYVYNQRQLPIDEIFADLTRHNLTQVMGVTPSSL
jgi:hypothetical protein